jgi:hypothetical protein
VDRWQKEMHVTHDYCVQHNGVCVSTCMRAGAGCGMTSIALAAAGFNVIAMEKENVSELLHRNIDINASVRRGSVDVCVCDWAAAGALEKILEQLRQKLNCSAPDLICLSDCLYQSCFVESLVSLLDQV